MNFAVHIKASRSINSKPLGVIPSINNAATASQAFSALEKGININLFHFGNGINFSTALVIIPRVPSDPTISCVKL